jgi:hypothetical protein
MATRYAEIGIIGLGARGLSVLERLCANPNEFVPKSDAVVVHIVDPSLAIGSRVWRTAPRASDGRHLSRVLDHMIQNAPDNVHVVRHAQQAVDLFDDEDGRQTVRLADGERLSGLHAVVLAQRHTESEPCGRVVGRPDGTT